MLVNRKRGPHAAPLRHVADAFVRDGVRRQAEDLLAVELHAAARRYEPCDGVAQRGLAHAVSANDCDDAFLEGERNALQRVRAAVEDVEVLNFEDQWCLPPM